MAFPNIEWVLLVPLYAVLGWQFASLGLAKPWRIACCLLLVAALVDPQLRLKVKGIDLWVLVDRSESVREWTEANLGEWETILGKSQGEHDRLRIVDFATEARARSASESSFVLEDRNQSKLGLALRQVLMLRDEDRASKALLLSDGYYTDSLEGVADAMVEAGIPFDFRLSSKRVQTDFQVSRLQLPDGVKVNEAFAIDARIEGSRDAAVRYTVFRNDKAIHSGTTELREGRRDLRFFDRVERASSVAYSVKIDGEGDQVSGNDRMTRWVQVAGPNRVLLLSNFAQDAVEQVLRRGGFSVERATDLSALDVRSLSGVSAVVINNVSANQIPQDFLKALDFFVQEQGGGLLMLGGPASFGSGGYYGSPVEPLIPVSMELKQDHKKLAVALCVVVDRSGSMGAGVEGAPGMRKIDLANAGVAQAVGMLGRQDAIAYLAVDTEAHVVVPLTDVHSNRSQVLDLVRRVDSMGGGIYVYEGLAAGWKELEQSQAGQRHMILFSDARDSEMPGEYEALIEEMVAKKTSISVIALGESTDPDAKLLKHIAELGGGRIFFNTNAADLPALFTQETVAIARSAFIEEETGTLSTAGWLELGGEMVDWLPLVQGYNLSYLQEGATMALASEDEYKAPLVAYWQKGVGRVAAVTFAMGGEHAWRALAWEEYGDFAQTLCRWLSGSRQLEGVSVESRVDGDRLVLDLFYDESRADVVSRQIPLVKLAEGDRTRSVVWERVEPGHLQLSSALTVNVPVRGAVRLGDSAYPVGPFFVGSDEEWRTDLQRIQNLGALSKESGGREVLDLSDAWAHPPQLQRVSLRPWILLALVLAFLVDVALTRLGTFRSLWGSRKQSQ
ncbi:VWA domain-containing protein [Pelagicoccus sp. SDUM812005]|uniref:VWA domain-containing protein n=1 Tax=Pelagicoccus sp. SDUM812005 TaxID=3041257 RepID=UPI00280DCE05|nr:VWA domain-containing protein [Pelagicoccus sp. SDUM812005]MDQ8182630.1 VWA domain-containing protein [Pelagicoccus sp. SDUM812005]